MGRSVLGEKRVQKIVDNLSNIETWAVGLIIGQRSELKDYVCHLVRTPVIDEEGKDVTESTTLDKVDEQWVAVHCKQVLRMLPGGLDVIGVFFVAPPEPAKAAQNKLKQVLMTVHKTTSKWQSQTVTLDNIHDNILLHICSLTKKLICRTYDVTDSKVGAKPADWKVLHSGESWVQLDTTMSFNVDFAIAIDRMSSSLLKQIQGGLSASFDNLRNALGTIDGCLHDEEATVESLYLASHSGKKKGKKNLSVSLEAQRRLEVQLFTSLKSVKDVSPPSVEDGGARMALRGTICTRAYVLAKSTVHTALQAVKQDILRSIQSRIEMLCEDLLQTEEDQDEHVLYEMPVRVFCSLSDSPLSVCDYMLQDEGTDDALDRFRDICGVTDASDDSIETGLERVPTEEELYEPLEKFGSEGLLDKSLTGSTLAKKTRGFLGLVAGATVAALAAGISYMYLGQE